MTDQPIACTLSPDRVPGRLQLIGALTSEALLDQQPIADGIRSRFRATADVERRVRDLVALESQCCGFLRFEIARDEHAVVLDITGSAAAQPVIEQFFAGAVGRRSGADGTEDGRPTRRTPSAPTSRTTRAACGRST